MKKLISFSLICLFTCTMFAQSGWRWQNPYPQGNGLNSIVMNGSSGWAVGDFGTVIHTAIGINWEPVDIGTTETLNCIYIDAISRKGWIVGNHGTIYSTRDYGETWTKQNSGTTEPLYSVSSIGGNCPWICGNDIILKSYDEGETWTKVSTYFHQRFYSIDHIDCSEIWISGKDGLVINTTDGGVTWQSHASRTSRDLYSIDVMENGEYLACGYSGIIVRSYDAGNTWAKENENSSYALKSIITKGIVGESYAVGEDGIILKALHNNPNWNLVKSNTLCTLNDVEFQSLTLTDAVYVAGQYGIILRKEDTDPEFEIVNERTNYGINAVEFTNKNKGWAVGGMSLDIYGNTKGGILQTTDGGETWETRQNLSKAMNAIDVIDENHVWAVGREGLILYTSNGGQSWNTPSSPLDGSLTSVCFIDENTGWIVTMSDWGKIIHTTNGGLTWTGQPNPTSNPLYDVFFINENKGWAVGLDSTILRTTNGGQNWERVITNAKEGYRFASVFFIDEMKGWVVGIYGSVLLTEDGGLTWQEINSGTSQLLNSVYFVDHKNGWITGAQGTILRSLDGGYTWLKQYSGVATNTLTSVYFIDALKGWVSGAGGTILATDNGGFWYGPGTFRSSGLNLPINDFVETKDVLILDISAGKKSGYQLTGLEVMLDSIIYSRVSDLVIKLSHNNVTVTLVDHVSDQGENFLWTKLTDEATKLITDGKAPYSGDHKSVNPLSAFNGLDPNGEWILTIYDSETGHTGTLNSWGIKPLFDAVTTSVNESNPNAAVQKIQLLQNAPNPFSGRTQINWTSEISGHTVLKIFNIHGQEITTLVNKFMPVGEYSIEFDGSQFSAGVYYCQLKVGDYILAKKCVIM